MTSSLLLLLRLIENITSSPGVYEALAGSESQPSITRRIGRSVSRSLHVRFLGLAESNDLDIWNYAIAHELTIVTQDSDYSDWNKLRGAPPKIVWIRCGNASVIEIGRKLREAASRILTLESDPEVEIVEVW